MDTINTMNITEIDEEIHLLCERLHCLRIRRNLLIPIVRIPPELLVRIFYALLPPLPDCLLSGDNRDYPALFTVSHVCQRWRNVAIDCSSLWAKPDLQKVEIAQLMLERAKKAPLFVFVDDDSDKNWPGSSAVTPSNISRATRMQLSAPGSSNPILARMFTAGAPVLRILVVQGYDRRARLGKYIKEVRDFFPSLRSLHLSNPVLEPWTKVNLSRLTSLCFSNASISVSDICELIRHMPSLESLDLQIQWYTDTSPAMCEVSLTRLHHLRFNGYDADFCLGLLRSINYPVETMQTVKYVHGSRMYLAEEVWRRVPSNIDWHVRLSLSDDYLSLEWYYGPGAPHTTFGKVHLSVTVEQLREFLDALPPALHINSVIIRAKSIYFLWSLLSLFKTRASFPETLEARIEENVHELWTDSQSALDLPFKYVVLRDARSLEGPKFESLAAYLSKRKPPLESLAVHGCDLIPSESVRLLLLESVKNFIIGVN